MPRARLLLPVLPIALGAAFAPAAGASTASVSGGEVRFDAAAGETNTAVITPIGVGPGGIGQVFFVGDQTPGATTTAGPGCIQTPAAGDLPAGTACTTLGATSLVAELGDGDDTGVVNAGTTGAAGTLVGGAGGDTLVGGAQADTFTGGEGTDTVAYVGIAAAGISRAAGVTATLPEPGAAPTTGNGATGEGDTITGDVEGLVGGQGDDALTGNGAANTIAGAAPEGTPGGVDTSPAGTDTIVGGGGDDTLVGGDAGSVTGGEGADTLVGGRSTAGTTTVRGDAGTDTLVSGLGSDDLGGGADADTLAYATVRQGSLRVVDRGTDGVTVTLPEAGATATGGRTGGPEVDVVRDDLETLVGGGGDDVLTGSSRGETITGAAPAGTPGGVVSDPAGTDTIDGRGGDDTLLGGDAGTVAGGPGADRLVGGRRTDRTTAVRGGDGDDTLISGLGSDDLDGEGGTNTLAYASVVQGGLSIVDRGRTGVSVQLPDPGGAPGAGGARGGAERDVVRPGFRTLAGSAGDDELRGGAGPETIVGAAPAGTPGVAPGGAGNDLLLGGAGNDLLLGAEGADRIAGGPGTDAMIAGGGDDQIDARDDALEAPSCGAGTDLVAVDGLDRPAPDCETVLRPATPPSPVAAAATPAADRTRPRLAIRPTRVRLDAKRRIRLRLSCANEPRGCRGTLYVRTNARRRVGGKLTRPLLARRTVRLTGPASRVVRVRLSRTVTRLVRRGGRLRLRVSFSARDAAGNRRVAVARPRLSRPR